jgi:hypothetical protein
MVSMKNCAVIIPSIFDVEPAPHEIEVAWIIAKHFKTTVEFLKPIIGYKIKTADFVANGLIWEVKSPTGNSRKHTVKDQFSRARGKKHNMIIDGRRTKLDDAFLQKRIRFELNTHRRVQRLIFITKSQQVVVIK